MANKPMSAPQCVALSWFSALLQLLLQYLGEAAKPASVSASPENSREPCAGHQGIATYEGETGPQGLENLPAAGEHAQATEDTCSEGAGGGARRLVLGNPAAGG